MATLSFLLCYFHNHASTCLCYCLHVTAMALPVYVTFSMLKPIFLKFLASMSQSCLYLAILPCLWLVMAVQCPWLAIAVYGWLWLSMSMAVYGWLSLAILPRLWLAMAVYIWLFYLVYGWLWLSISGYFTSSLAVYGWLGSRDYVTTITVRVKITTNTYVYATTMTTFAYVITRFAQCIWIWNWFCFDGLAYKRLDPIRPAVTIYTIQYIRPKYVNFSMLRCCCI